MSTYLHCFRLVKSFRLVKKKCFFSAIALAIFFGPVINVFAYNTFQAKRYADKWWDDRNIPFFNDYSADCANFVSQCLISGGIDLIDGPNYNEHGKHVIIKCGGTDSSQYWGLGENIEWY